MSAHPRWLVAVRSTAVGTELHARTADGLVPATVTKLSFLRSPARGA